MLRENQAEGPDAGRRTLVPGLVDNNEDLAGCILAESGTALTSMLIRLKQIDGLNHNAVVIGPGAEGRWRIAEAIARGCVINERRLSTGYIVRFDDAALRQQIAASAQTLATKGMKYDYATIAWHLCDFFVWAAPVVGLVIAAVMFLFGSSALIALVVAIMFNPVFRIGRHIAGRASSDDRQICSELTLNILAGAGVAVPSALDPSATYKPTPIDVTRWLIGRADWRDRFSTSSTDTGSAVWSAAKQLVGVDYSLKVPGPSSPPDPDPKTLG